MKQAAALALFALAGCQSENRTVCIAAPTLEDTLKLGSDSEAWRQKVDACVARWANRIAAAPGSTREIAQASIGACLDAIESRASVTNRELLKDGVASDTYEKTVSDMQREATQKAMFYVAMNRAGHCTVR